MSSAANCAGPVPRLAPEPSITLLIRPHRPEKVNFSEGWPISIRKVEFTVGALPKEETGEPDLTARTDYQVRIRKFDTIKMFGNCGWCHLINGIPKVLALCELV